MGAWLMDFFTKHLWTLLSILADVLVVLFVAYSVWMIFHPKPTTTQNQSAGKIYNYVIYPDKLDFALGKIGGFEFISYHSIPSSAKTKVVVK